MNTTQSNNSWKSVATLTRITWAITRKDILEAIRNKNILALLASSLFIVLLYRALPLLESATEKPYLLVYDAGNSSLVTALENSPAVYVFTYPSEAEMKNFLSRGEVPELGLVIPEGFDQSVETGSPLPLQGYVLNWINEKQANELESFSENEIAGILGKSVDIQMEGNVVYMTPQTDGYGVSVGMALTLVVIMIGTTSIPHLMMEEKKNHTIETLLISPASPVHVVSAKALAGLFYCMLGGLVSLTVNNFIVLHWWLALLAVFCGALFTVTLGLLLGILVEDRAQLSLIAWLFLLPLILPLILSLFDGLTPSLRFIMQVIPSTVMFDLLRSSFAYSFDWGEVWLRLAWLLVCSGIGQAAIVWIMRRQSRQNEGSPLIMRSTLTEIAPSVVKQPTSQIAARAKPLVQVSATSLSHTTDKRKIGKQPHNGTLAIIMAITAKDIRDAMRSKMLVSILMGVMIIILTGLALPSILGLTQKPAMIVYDPGHSTLLREMATNPDFRQLVVDSPQAMLERIGASTELVLGLVWPENFDQLAGAGSPIDIDGYIVHWAKPDETAEMISFFEDKLSQESRSEGKAPQVHILLDSQRAYPSARPDGTQNQVVTSTLTTALLCIGFLLSPFLIIEEKESHTFEALLVSPASFAQVISGKLLVGLVYCLIATLGVLLFTHQLIVQWHILLLAVLLGAAFAVAMGILMGLVCDTQATLAIWGGLALILLLVPGMMSYFDTSNWPALIQTAINIMPATAIANLTGIALSNQLPADLLWQSIQSLLAVSVLAYALVAFVMKRAKQRGY